MWNKRKARVQQHSQIECVCDWINYWARVTSSARLRNWLWLWINEWMHWMNGIRWNSVHFTYPSFLISSLAKGIRTKLHDYRSIMWICMQIAPDDSIWIKSYSSSDTLLSHLLLSARVSYNVKILTFSFSTFHTKPTRHDDSTVDGNHFSLINFCTEFYAYNNIIYALTILLYMNSLNLN